MQFYAKLILLITAFIGLANSVTRDIALDWAYAARVKYVLTFGSEADYESLLDDTQRALAVQAGGVDTYEFGKRWRALLDQRLAEAARRGIRLTDEEVDALRQKCAHEAYAPLADADQRRVGTDDQTNL